MLIYDSDYKIEVHLFIVSTIPIPFDKREKKKTNIYIKKTCEFVLLKRKNNVIEV